MNSLASIAGRSPEPFSDYSLGMEQLADVVGILHQGRLLEGIDLKAHLNQGGEPLEPYLLRKIGGGGIA